MEVSKNTRQYLWLEDSLRKRELIMKRHYASSKVHFHQSHHGTCFHDEVESTLDGCKDSLPEWCDEEEVDIEQPQGFEVEDRVTHVCQLKKALYGLKQAPRAWYGRIDSFLTSWALLRVNSILTFT